ncbi:MAG: DUF1203 domain-containing protein [Pseudomonadota bacterium]
MDFQISALPAQDFAALFSLSDQDLARQQARRMVVRETPGTPCRVSLQDAAVGETVLLLNYTHQPADSPYRATHAIFVREGAKEAKVAINEVPKVLRQRLISLRLFDANHMMIDADVVDGADLGSALSTAFDDPSVAYAHLHNAKPGCFHAAAHRA